MVKVVKKVKKIGLTGRSSGGPRGETSDLRPKFSPKIPPCITNCPNHNDIRGMLTAIAQSELYGRSREESFSLAFQKMAESSPFLAVCGRICPHPCETECNRGHLEGSEFKEENVVGINSMERAVGDFALEHNLQLGKISEEVRPEKIAIIGSGPGGLSCAYHLARLGYKVTVFEAFPKPGGMLRYGIPPYRLPREILDAEIDRIAKLGVEIRCNTIIGKDISYEELKKNYNSVFIGIGAHKGYKLSVAGEDAENVMSGAEFLNRINSGHTIEVGDKVVVIGGGDSAIDAARVSKRLGADTTILYRRTIKEMPAIEHEVQAAQEEGIKIEFLAAPIEILRKNGRAEGMKCIRMELGEPDASGRRRPVPMAGSEFEMSASMIIPSISQEPDFTGLENFKEGKDWVKVDHRQRTKDNGTFAGGDVIDLGTVIKAIYHGRLAAEAIHEYIQKKEHLSGEELPKILWNKMKMDPEHYKKTLRNRTKSIPVGERFKSLDLEVVHGLNEAEAFEEAKRCLSCGQCFFCGNCWMFCQDQAVIKPQKKGEPYLFKMEFCTGCKKCAEECPCGYIDMI